MTTTRPTYTAEDFDNRLCDTLLTRDGQRVYCKATPKELHTVPGFGSWSEEGTCERGHHVEFGFSEVD